MVGITSSRDTDCGRAHGDRLRPQLRQPGSRDCATTAEVVAPELTMRRYVEAHLASLMRAGLSADATTHA